MPQSQTPKQGFVHPAGAYRLKIVDHVISTSGNDNTKLVFSCTVEKVNKLADPSQASKIDKLGKKRNVEFYFTPKTREKSFAFLKAAGFSGKIPQLDQSTAQQAGLPFVSLAGFEFDASNNPEARESGDYKGIVFDRFQAFSVRDEDSWKKNLKGVSNAKLENLDNLWAVEAKGANTTANINRAVNPPTSSNEPVDGSFDWNA